MSVSTHLQMVKNQWQNHRAAAELIGIAISAGSACHSGKLTPSPVLPAMGYHESAAKGTIRLTGRHTTVADVDWAAMVLKFYNG